MSSVRLVPGGLDLGGQLVPLHAGAVHYFRLEPSSWRPCLEAVKDMGLRLVDVHVPWSFHETAPGVFDFGASDPARDVAGFLRVIAELGLYAIVRPGPHINAEMTYFGIPERVIWDSACQARSPRNHPVMLPMFPVGFPVPSYGSDAFFDEVARYFHALGPVLSPLVYPAGPIVMVQVDHEGAFYFRDGLYDQDYHPDAVQRYRAHLRDKYKTVQALPPCYLGLLARSSPAVSGSPEEPSTSQSAPAPELRFTALDPPARFDAESLDELAVHLDWAESQEVMLASAFSRFRGALEQAGLHGIPTMHNLPPGEEATPLSAAVVSRAVDLVGLDYYYRAGVSGRAIVARRTGEIAAFAESRGLPAFASEMAAGFPPFFPPLDEHDSAFTALSALAYGLRGMNVYMAVERDRWIGAPIDRRGRARPFASFFRRLLSALDATGFHALRRRTPVRVVVPRTERRLARAMHAFGPFPGTAFAMMNTGARERCVEDALGSSAEPSPMEPEAHSGRAAPIGIAADTFVRAFEQALDARGVPFAIVEALDGEVPLDGARWALCATSGGLSPALFKRLSAARAEGCSVTFGPVMPHRDGSFLPLSAPFSWSELGASDGPVPLFVDGSPAAADRAVAHAIDALGLPTFACDPHGVLATVHEDQAGRPRVLFVINPTDSDLVARVSIGACDARTAHDLLEDERAGVTDGSVEVRVPPRVVRMFSLI